MRTSINVVGDSFGAGIVDHLSRAELAELDAAELQLQMPPPPPPPLGEGEEGEEGDELGFIPPPPLLDPLDAFKPPELPPRSPRPPKQNHHAQHSLTQSHSLTYSPARSARSPSPHSVRSPSPRSVCSHSPRPFRTHSPRLLHRTEPGYCALPSHDNQVRTPGSHQRALGRGLGSSTAADHQGALDFTGGILVEVHCNVVSCFYEMIFTL